jgi:hypothetical protein
MLKQLNRGDIVSVFQDPLTCLDLEGHAELLRLVHDNEEGLQRWVVRFVDDPCWETYERAIWRGLDGDYEGGEQC